MLNRIQSISDLFRKLREISKTTKQDFKKYEMK